MNDYWNKIKEWNKQNKTWFWGGIGGVIITIHADRIDLKDCFCSVGVIENHFKLIAEALN